MDTAFFKSTNLNNIFEDVNNIVFQNTNVNIKSHDKTAQQFKKMAHIVAKKFLTDSITLDELNNKLMQNATTFFTNLVNQKKLHNRSTSSGADIIPSSTETGNPQDYLPPVASLAPTDVSVLSSSNSNMPPMNTNQNEYTVDPNLPEVIGNSLPLFDNIAELTADKETVDLDSRVNDYLSTRNNIMSGGVEEPPSQRIMYETPINRSVEANGTQNNKHAEIVSRETAIRSGVSDNQVVQYQELDRKIEEKFARITERIETALINPTIDEKLFAAMFKAQNKAQPKYMTRSNYIIVNSADRDWLNESLDGSNRYNFNVKFGKHDNSASINNVYKNITSIELVNAFMPKDNVLLGFDTRPYVDILTYPYLVLKIPELTNVFRGTNNSTDNAFSVLVYDKKHDSQVLSNDFISGSNTIVQSAPDRQFYSEYNKSYYKYIPAYFEKKVYDNQPLASLSHMSISVVNPNNEDINVMRDVMAIDDIGFTAVTATNLEYSGTNAYPNDASAASREYINISVSQVFSNKLYRIGDNIKLGGFTTASGSSANEVALAEYLNRSEGHYILNLQQSNLAAGANQGFITDLYIAPPGDISVNTTGSLNSSTYIGSSDIDTLSNISTSGARLLNTNLQTHFLFKINTREGDFQSVHNAMNI
jgi:hypothetical protein